MVYVGLLLLYKLFFHLSSVKVEPVIQNEMGYKSGVFFANWSVYDKKHFPIDLKTDYLTHIFYAFLSIDEASGKVKFSDEWCDIQLPMVSPRDPTKKVEGNLQQLFQMKQMNRNLKVIMSIGGWGTSHLFQAVMADESRFNNFVNTCLFFIEEYGFDGVDIDWEYPLAHEHGLVVKLLRELRLKMDRISNRLSLSYCGSALEETINRFDLKDLDKYLSFWNLMCYDFAGQGYSSKTGFHSNLFGKNGDNSINTADVVEKYLSLGIPANKLILGMPLYGKQFHNVQKGEIGQSFANGSEAENTFNYNQLPKGQELFDSTKVSASSYDSATKLFVTYDNEKSAQMKADFTQQMGLGGGMWWDSSGDVYDNDEKSLIVNYIDQLGGPPVLEKSENHLDIYGKSKYLRKLL